MKHTILLDILLMVMALLSLAKMSRHNIHLRKFIVNGKAWKSIVHMAWETTSFCDKVDDNGF